jgi:arylformamidase
MFTYLSYFMNKNTPLYGGAMGVEVSINSSLGKGDSSNTKKLAFHNHSGTHIDFPNHFILEGKTSQAYKANDWVFQHPYLLTVEAEENELIFLTTKELKKLPRETDFLILKTGFGKFRGQEKYWKYNPGLSPDLADMLRAHLPNLRVIGMDFISITSYQNREIGRVAHRNFLGGDTPLLLVEDMDLSSLSISPKYLICSPLLIDDLDGSPVTIFAEIDSV